MPRQPQPIRLEIDIDTSPEAKADYLEAIKFLVRRIHARRAAAVEDPVKARLLARRIVA